jgi:hypothetical protein
MKDKVKPLGIESTATGGSQDEPFSTEMNPQEDYASIKGVTFEDDDDTCIYGDSGLIGADTGGVQRLTIEDDGEFRLKGETSGYLGIKPNTNAGTVTYEPPTVDGTNGQSLFTNGSAVLNWRWPERFYPQFIFTGQMNFDQYLYAWQHDGSGSRRSGEPSNGWQFSDSSPIVVPFNGVVKSATFRNRGVAQSTDTPAANMTLRYELWNVGVTGGEGTKIADVEVTFTTAGKTIGNFWNSAVNTNLNEFNNSLNISVSRGDLLGLKFIRIVSSSGVTSTHNATVILEIERTS